MALKKFRPVTPSLRQKVGNAFAEITASKPCKKLTVGISKTGGRNNSGKMTVRNRGGGHKRRYRIIDFKRTKFNMNATVLTIEYDPNRSAFISLVQYTDGEKRYIIAPNGLTVGMTIVSGSEALPELGNTLPLAKIPLGASIHALEIVPGRGAALARSAGTNAEMIGKEGKYAIIKLPSGEVRKILLTCTATMGSTSNPDHRLQVSGKAGRSRWLGKRPRVRGVAMNPVDHPMGGGEGRASGGHPRSRTGIMAKGQKTRNKRKHSTKLILTTRKKKSRK